MSGEKERKGKRLPVMAQASNGTYTVHISDVSLIANKNCKINDIPYCGNQSIKPVPTVHTTINNCLPKNIWMWLAGHGKTRDDSKIFWLNQIF